MFQTTAAIFVVLLSLGRAPDQPMDNPAIDMTGFLRVSEEAALHRQTRRLTEETFIRFSSEPNTIVLDARSKAKFDLLHIQGAINLNFSDITIESLQQTIPDKSTRILIYCNNNFKNEEAAFPAKMASASLNLSTYVTLYNYGYRNVFELAPLLDPKESKLTLVASQDKAPRSSIPSSQAPAWEPTVLTALRSVFEAEPRR